MSVWTAAKEQLRLQMTQATFDTWIKETEQIGDLEAGTLTIGVPTAFAQDWLANRLYETLQRSVIRVTGSEVELLFVVEPLLSSTNGSGDAAPEPELEPGQLAVQLFSFDPTQRGFVMTSNYATRFWQPYLDLFKAKVPPFTVWQTLKSFAFECQMKDWPSIEMLADICARGQRYKLLGRAERKGCGRIVGAFEVLEGERIIYIKKTGRAKRISYHFRVMENLPLLTPRQVERLPERVQRSHKNFIKKCQIDYEEWEQMTLNSLMESP